MKPPSDLGLPSLGLVCLALLHTSVAFGTLAVVGQMGLLRSGGDRVLTALVLVAGFVRAAFHGRVAERLRERSPDLIGAIHRYTWVAAGSTALLVVVAASAFGAPPSLMVGLALIGLAWPLTLWLLVSRKAVRAAFATSDTFELELVPADRSVEGLGVLMVTFSSLGLGILVSQLPTLIDELDGLAPLLVVAVALNVVALIARGALHFATGLRAMRGLPPERLDKAVSTYLSLAYLTAGLLVLAFFALARGHISPSLIGTALVGGYFFLAWPLVVRRFANRLLFDADGQPLPPREHGPASDRGLSAFGYLLLAVSGQLVATHLAALITVVEQAGGPGLGLIDVGLDAALSIALGLSGIWAGLEMITVSPRRTVAMLIYAAASAFLLLQALVLNDAAQALTPTQLAMVLPLSCALPAVGVALLFRRPASPAEVTPPRGTPARTD